MTVKKKNEKSIKKAQVRENIVKDYQAGMSIEKLMKKYSKSKKQVVGILVYEGVYKKADNERDKILNELKIDKNVAKNVSTKFLKYLYENFNISKKS